MPPRVVSYGTDEYSTNFVFLCDGTKEILATAIPNKKVCVINGIVLQNPKCRSSVPCKNYPEMNIPDRKKFTFTMNRDGREFTLT
jgi:hypothetical protein